MNHYDWLREHIPAFFKAVGVSWEGNEGIIVAHGDKCYGYQNRFRRAGIPFEHGVALYLLTHTRPFSAEVRDVRGKGWVAPVDWVIENIDRFRSNLPPAYSKVE